MEGNPKNIDNVTRLTPTGAKPENTTPVAPDSGRNLISWESPSFQHQEKGVWWYVAAITLVLAISGYFIWSHDWFSLAITIVVSGVLFWYVFTARPKNLSYALTSLGVMVGDKFYPYTDIYAYWFVYNPKYQKLNFIFAKKYLPALSIDITGVNVAQIRAVLSRRLPEQTDRGENLLDRLIRVTKL